MKYISKEKVLACHNKVDCAGHLVTHLRAATNLNVDYKGKLPCSMRLRKVILTMQFGAKDFFHLCEVSYIIVTGSPGDLSGKKTLTVTPTTKSKKHKCFYFKMAHPSPFMTPWQEHLHLTSQALAANF